MTPIKEYYLAFEYLDSDTTTWGDRNPKTKRFSVAGHLLMFGTEIARMDWVYDEPGVRFPLTRREARGHCLGLSVADYRNLLDDMYAMLPEQEKAKCPNP